MGKKSLNLRTDQPFKSGMMYMTNRDKAKREIGPEGSLWNPSRIDTIGWYDASDLTSILSSRGLVYELRDKSGAGQVMVQTTEALRPITGTRTLNGLNALDCQGTQYMQDAVYNVPASGDIMIIMTASADVLGGTFDSIFSMNATNDFQLESYDSGGNTGRINVTNIGADKAFTGGPFTGPSVYGITFDFNDTGFYNAFVDGDQKTTDTSYIAKLDQVQDFKLFANRSGGDPIDGLMGEVVVTEDVTVATRQKIEGYLAWKWDMVANLDGGHPYKSAAPVIT